jgi:alanyl-tRNA synthetase
MDHHSEPVKTRRLYFEDATRLEFEAAVVEHRTVEGRSALVLDQTCFYPESGGQPWDKGTIEGVDVLQVVEEGETIIHVLAADVAGDRVRGRVDGAVRFDHMQQHSGQHILSQAFYELLRGETKSFHLGPAVSTLEIGIAQAGDADQERVERRANEIVFENREIRTYFVPEARIGDVPLRRPPKVSGLIRVVEADAYDYSACGGTHCRRTGEIGLIKIIKTERIRGNLRFEFVCGGRALRDYELKNRVVRRLVGRFNVGESDVADAVEKLAEDLKALKRQARRTEDALGAFEIRELLAKAAGPILRGTFADRTPEGIRTLALGAIRQGDCAALFGTKTAARSHVVLAASDGLKLDLRPLLPELAALMNGRGGGGPTLVEIAGGADADLEAVLRAAEERVRRLLGADAKVTS